MIYKFALNLYGECTISLPRGTTILSVQNQHGSLVMWVQTGQGPVENRTFCAFTTGVLAPKGQYLNTVQFDNGEFVIHVYETTVR